jgi:hypothetical protein
MTEEGQQRPFRATYNYVCYAQKSSRDSAMRKTTAVSQELTFAS